MILLISPGVQVPLLGVRTVEVDGVGCGILLLDDQIQVIPQLVAQLPELSLPLILQTESEGLNTEKY